MHQRPVAVRVWDLPTRVFHWLLALDVLASIVSAKVGGNAIVWHFRFGYAACALLAFRLLWGFVGGRWSRFASFTYSPASVRRYLQGRSLPTDHHHVGHNPLGAWSVYAMTAVLALQVGSGLCADDEISSAGPLVRFVTSDTSLALTRWHRHTGQWSVIALAALHVAAILYYRWFRHTDLLRPMITGDKSFGDAVPASVDNARRRCTALVLFLACAAAVGWAVQWAGQSAG